jgi:hypothetical protein
METEMNIVEPATTVPASNPKVPGGALKTIASDLVSSVADALKASGETTTVDAMIAKAIGDKLIVSGDEKRFRPHVYAALKALVASGALVSKVGRKGGFSAVKQ